MSILQMITRLIYSLAIKRAVQVEFQNWQNFLLLQRKFHLRKPQKTADDNCHLVKCTDWLLGYLHQALWLRGSADFFFPDL